MGFFTQSFLLGVGCALAFVSVSSAWVVVTPPSSSSTLRQSTTTTPITRNAHHDDHDNKRGGTMMMMMQSCPRRASSSSSSTRLQMALDYNDPVVAEEFNAVQPMTYEEVEEELLEQGIRTSPTMNEMEVKLILVEVRLRNSGKIGGDEGSSAGAAGAEAPKTSFGSKFEEALYKNPVFEDFYNNYKEKGDVNSMNVIAEYVNDPVLGDQRYGKDYRGLIRELNRALTAPPPVKSATITFSGFPANMGEQGCRMTLEALGGIEEFECTPSDDFPILTGKVTFEDIETAKKAIEQYNGMDMGMGTVLQIVSV